MSPPQVLRKTEAAKFPERRLLAPPPAFPRRGAWPPGEVIANQSCAATRLEDRLEDPDPLAAAFSGEVIANRYVRSPPPQAPPPEPLDCPTCGHAYNSAHKRPRLLSCLHSVCEECLQILYESCPKYKFISCPSCGRETVLFTDYGLAALAVNTALLARLPEEGLGGASSSERGGVVGGASGWENERGCYGSFREYCGGACACRAVGKAGASCAVM